MTNDGLEDGAGAKRVVKGNARWQSPVCIWLQKTINMAVYGKMRATKSDDYRPSHKEE